MQAAVRSEQTELDEAWATTGELEEAPPQALHPRPGARRDAEDTETLERPGQRPRAASLVERPPGIAGGEAERDGDVFVAVGQGAHGQAKWCHYDGTPPRAAHPRRQALERGLQAWAVS